MIYDDSITGQAESDMLEGRLDGDAQSEQQVWAAGAVVGVLHRQCCEMAVDLITRATCSMGTG